MAVKAIKVFGEVISRKSFANVELIKAGKIKNEKNIDINMMLAILSIFVFMKI